MRRDVRKTEHRDQDDQRRQREIAIRLHERRGQPDADAEIERDLRACCRSMTAGSPPVSSHTAVPASTVFSAMRHRHHDGGNTSGPNGIVWCQSGGTPARP